MPVPNHLPVLEFFLKFSWSRESETKISPSNGFESGIEVDSLHLLSTPKPITLTSLTSFFRVCNDFNLVLIEDTKYLSQSPMQFHIINYNFTLCTFTHIQQRYRQITHDKTKCLANLYRQSSANMSAVVSLPPNKQTWLCFNTYMRTAET